MRRHPGFRHVLVWRVQALAEARFNDVPDLEARLDRLVSELGGERLKVVDPWRWLPDLVRRARGQLLPLREDLYAIPEDFFTGSDQQRSFNRQFPL